MINEEYLYYKDCKKARENGKKLVVLYGNCHTTAIRILLNQYEDFRDNFCIFPLKAIQEVSDPKYFFHPVFDLCDVFIHQAIRNNNRYGKEYSSENMLMRLKNSCQVFSIPNLYHLPLFYFPQYIEKTEFVSEKSTVFFRDSILDRIYEKNGWNVTKAIQTYKNGSYFDDTHINTLFEIFVKKMTEREKEWDIKILDFILDNIKKHQLFFDPNHPTPYLISYIAEQILYILDVRINRSEMSKKKQLFLNAYEMPLHESVIQYFNMDFRRKNIRYDKKGFFNDLNLKRYIERYWLFEWQNLENKKSNIYKSRIAYESVRALRAVYTKLKQ